MLKITHATTLRPVQIARLLEQQGSPLAPLAEEIFDLAVAYRIDAAFALAQWKVESDFGRLPLAQAHRNAAMTRLALTRLTAPARHADSEAPPILPTRYGDALGSGYVSYPSWLAGLEEYFRLLRCVLVDAWHEEEVEQIARRYLMTLPGRKPVPAAPRAGGRGGSKRRARQRKAAQPRQPPLVSPEELAGYARRIEQHRAAFQAGMLAAFSHPTGT